MSQSPEFTKYGVLAQLKAIEIQNPQELASIWGEIENQCEEVGVEIDEVFVSLGPYDFLVLLDAPSRDQVLKSSIIMTRYGLEVHSMGLVPREQFAGIVQDM